MSKQPKQSQGGSRTPTTWLRSPMMLISARDDIDDTTDAAK